MFFYAFLTFHGCKRPRTSVPVPKWLASNLRQTLSICDFRLTVVFVHADINFLIVPETGDRSYKQFPRKYRSWNEANVCLRFTVLPGNPLLSQRITVHVHRWLFNSAMGGQNVLSIFKKMTGSLPRVFHGEKAINFVLHYLEERNDATYRSDNW